MSSLVALVQYAADCVKGVVGTPCITDLRNWVKLEHRIPPRLAFRCARGGSLFPKSAMLLRYALLSTWNKLSYDK